MISQIGDTGDVIDLYLNTGTSHIYVGDDGLVKFVKVTLVESQLYLL